MLVNPHHMLDPRPNHQTVATEVYLFAARSDEKPDIQQHTGQRW